jgi:hypothetical protein
MRFRGFTSTANPLREGTPGGVKFLDIGEVLRFRDRPKGGIWKLNYAQILPKKGVTELLS